MKTRTGTGAPPLALALRATMLPRPLLRHSLRALALCALLAAALTPAPVGASSRLLAADTGMGPSDMMVGDEANSTATIPSDNSTSAAPAPAGDSVPGAAAAPPGASAASAPAPEIILLPNVTEILDATSFNSTNATADSPLAALPAPPIPKSPPSPLAEGSNTTGGFGDVKATQVNETAVDIVAESQDEDTFPYWQQGQGNPTGTLNQACRVALVEMFGNSTACSTDGIEGTCTAAVHSLLEWRLLCLSGVYKAQAATLFAPGTQGLAKVKWGKSYLALLGTLSATLPALTNNEDQTTTYNKVKRAATLGPVLKALVAGKSADVISAVSSWTMAISTIMTPLPPDMITKMVLGGRAMEAVGQRFTLDNALEGVEGVENGTLADSASNSSALPEGRQLGTIGDASSQMQFITLPFSASVSIGSTYRRDMTYAGPSLWYTSMWNLAFSALSYTDRSKVCYSSKEASEMLEVSGSAEYNGVGFGVSASGSFMRSSLASSSAVTAMITKRIMETGTEVLNMTPDKLPVLSNAAKAVLRDQGAGSFEAQYGAYFVLGYLRMAVFDGSCSAFSSSSQSNTEVAASLKGNYGAFSAQMETKWKSASASSSITFECKKDGSGSGCNADPQSISTLSTCANNVNDGTIRDRAYQAILMRFVDLPSYKDIASGSALPIAMTTPFDLLDTNLKIKMKQVWARADYLSQVNAQQLPDSEKWPFLSDLQRIMQVVSALAVGKALDATSVVRVYRDGQYGGGVVAGGEMRLGAGQTSQVFSLDAWLPSGTASSVQVGPGLLVTLTGGATLVTAFNMESFTNLMQNFDNVARGARLESTAAMSQTRRWEVLSAVEAELYRYEVMTSWVSVCFDRSTPTDVAPGVHYLDRHDVSCGGDEVLQRFRLVRPSSTTIRYDYRCCRLPSREVRALNTDFRGADTPSAELWQGDFRSLKPHNIDCGGPRGGTVQRFKLAMQYTGDRTRRSCEKRINGCSGDRWDSGLCQQGTTGDNGASGSSWRHIGYDTNGCYNDCCCFRYGMPICRYGRDGMNAFYDVTCMRRVTSPGVDIGTCRDLNSGSNDDGGGWLIYLDRHNVECAWDERLTQFQLYSDTGKIWFQYKCCSLPK